MMLTHTLNPLSVLALADLALRAVFAPEVLTIITTDNGNTPLVSERSCKHPLVRKVTFTVSTAVGSIVAKHCSDGLKKVYASINGHRLLSAFKTHFNLNLMKTKTSIMGNP